MQQHESNEEDRILETEPKSDLNPPRRRPPTAVGAETPVPGGSPRSQRLQRKKRKPRSFLVQIIDAVADIAEESVHALGRLFAR